MFRRVFRTPRKPRNHTGTRQSQTPLGESPWGFDSPRPYVRREQRKPVQVAGFRLSGGTRSSPQRSAGDRWTPLCGTRRLFRARESSGPLGRVIPPAHRRVEAHQPRLSRSATRRAHRRGPRPMIGERLAGFHRHVHRRENFAKSALTPARVRVVHARLPGSGLRWAYPVRQVERVNG